MRGPEVIDSELRLLAAVRRVCREQDGVLPSIGPVDELLDERRELDRKLTAADAIDTAGPYAFLHRVIVDMTADAIDTAGSI
jgi:hypothetical protein